MVKSVTFGEFFAWQTVHEDCNPKTHGQSDMACDGGGPMEDVKDFTGVDVATTS